MNADELSERLDYNERVIGTKILRAMLIIAESVRPFVYD